MHPPPSPLAHRSVLRAPARHLAVRRNSWLACTLVTVVSCWLPTGNRCSARAAENLWLDVARSSITSDELRGHVGVLADDMLEGREAGSRGGHAAAKYLVQRLEEAGLMPAGPNAQYTQPFHRNSRNLLALLAGIDPDLQGEYLVIGAHYDHVGYGNRRNSYGPIGYIHNGADDNASGVAALLEVVDALSRTEYRPRRSILFAFWDGEEKGLLGSKHWMNNPTVPSGAIQLAINIDMVGRLTDGRIEVGGSRSGRGLRRLMSSPSLSPGTWLDFSWEYKDNSDHWTFFQAGVPSVYVHTGLHDDYHRPSDDVEKINVDGMREISRYLLATLSKLADVDRLPEFRETARRETPHTQQRQQHPLPELASRLGFGWTDHNGQPVVTSVQRGSTATEAGVIVGDRIVRLNGRPMTDETLLPALAMRDDESVELEIERGGTDMPVTLTVPLIGDPVRLGLSWREDPAEPQTVYVTRVVPYSPAAMAGIRLYDRVYGVEGHPISGQDDLLARIRSLLDEQAPALRLEVESRGVVQEVVVSLEPSSNDSTDPAI